MHDAEYIPPLIEASLASRLRWRDFTMIRLCYVVGKRSKAIVAPDIQIESKACVDFWLAEIK